MMRMVLLPVSGGATMIWTLLFGQCYVGFIPYGIGMTLDLAYLEDFRALVESGNFSRAALQRNLTQPAFSRRIRALEEWAGATLFDREGQPITLTEAGRALQPMLAEALRCLHQGREQARAAAARGRATLCFAATHVLSFTFFPAWLGELEGGPPPEAIQLVSDSLSACEQQMLQGRAQFLLCHHHPSAPVRLDPSHFTSITVGTDLLCPVSAADAAGAPLHALDTTAQAALPYLAYSEDSGLGRIVAGAQGGGGLRLDRVFTSHLAAALRSMARAGRGVAWLPRSLIAGDLAQGRLVRAGPASLDVAVNIDLFRAKASLEAGAERFWAQLPRSASTH
jgi:DNA-binding transcriptional LysR family regulator